MNILRKSLKAYSMVSLLFLILTLLLALLIKLTGFDEGWSKISLMIILVITCFLISYLEGKIIGSKGLIVGISATALLLLALLIVLNVSITGSFTIKNSGLFLPIEFLAGAIGGVIGANSDK